MKVFVDGGLGMNVAFILRRICSLILIGIGYYLFWPDIVLVWNQKGLKILNDWFSMGLLMFFYIIPLLFIVQLIKLLMGGYLFRENEFKNGSLKQTLLLLLPIQNRKTLLLYAVESVIIAPAAFGIVRFVYSDRFHFHPITFLISLIVGFLIAYSCKDKVY
ncbi:hypothetical protein Dred_0833 [Desulforamulus reducens MI-1]|uniref:Uncharacterized protein n=1 Tax=Desulforamulus reducens (strain ATCC BAA-1160 / DSM 100696 / MI-1) TaxID=349161 RepID=A4J2R8_DESRM|nr:hypothetical protein [Desulforamulus reducens]ABO49371.1 hypothetical protein Dred_0833 [Desulforamulus reducens MI-1]